MKMKMLFVLALVLVMTTAGYAQGLNGKWVTDPPAAPAAAPAAPPAGGAPAGATGGGGGGGGRGGGGRGGGGQTRLDLTIAAGKVTGSMFEGGADLEIKEGTATDKQAKWYTIRPLNGADFRVNWTADLSDENTITLSREFPNGAPAGGGGGRGGGAPGGAPPAGAAPPAGGAPPAAAAGAAPAGGAPGGGGGGGRGGGGRGGVPGPVTLHRAK